MLVPQQTKPTNPNFPLRWRLNKTLTEDNLVESTDEKTFHTQIGKESYKLIPMTWKLLRVGKLTNDGRLLCNDNIV